MTQMVIPASYWLLTLLWLVILGLYLLKLRESKVVGGTIKVLLILLAIDAFRTLFESVYFGLYFNSMFGLLPYGIYDLLPRPAMIIIPKLINIAAAILILVLLIRRWIPGELSKQAERVSGLEKSEHKLRQSEELLKQEKQQLVEVLWGTNAGIWTWDIQTDTHTYSESWAELLGYSLAELHPLSSKSWKGLLHLDDIDRAINLLDQHFSRCCDYFECELRLRHKNGDWIWLLNRGKVVEWSDSGDPLRMSGTLVDISERKRLEQAAVRQRAEFEAIFNAMADTCIFVDPQRKIQRINSVFSHMFYYQPEDVIGQTTQMLYADPESYKTQGQKRFNPQASPTDSISEINYRRKDGSIFSGETLGSHVLDEKGKLLGYLGVIRDVTARKQAEQERELLIAAIEQADETIVITDHKGNIQYTNPAFEKITGFTRAEAAGQNPRILQSGEHDNNFYQAMWDTLIQGKTWSGRLVNKKKNGLLYTENARISPVLDMAGEIINFIAVKHDITAELELEQQMMQGQKLEIIGTLASGIAHDFNNILTPVIGYSHLMIEKHALDQEDNERLSVILTSAHRAKDLIDQILNFSHQAEEEWQPLQMKAQIEETLNLLRASIASSIEFSYDLQNLQILAPSAKIHQLMLNLCTNAAQAMKQTGGQIDIKLKARELKSGNPLRLPAGQYAHLSIRDNGPGIDPAILPQIFNPYFTTKETGEGSGIGLATVHRVVSALSGSIKVESQLGEGTTFHILLPTINTDEPSKTQAHLPALPKGNQHILVVDDEDYLIDITSEFLRIQGYRVTEFTCSLDALQAVTEQPDNFDLLLTDLTMPKISGIELAQKIGQINPELPVIICTGQLTPLTAQETANINLLKTLQKPDILSELALTLHQHFND